jgi:hypothetical protein
MSCSADMDSSRQEDIKSSSFQPLLSTVKVLDAETYLHRYASKSYFHPHASRWKTVIRRSYKV